jgi:hypothetical protein
MNPTTQTNRRPKTLEESFASSHRAKYWHPTKNDNLQPRDIYLKSGKKVWFSCTECGHDFDMVPSDIAKRNSWCRYCTHQQLCPDLTCVKCHENSFASSDKAGYWVYDLNNNITPRDVFRSARSRHWFKCNTCAHVFDAVLNDISANKWCPYCVNKRSCGNECPICFNHNTQIS